jgi:Tfp pilus assembly protein PilF
MPDGWMPYYKEAYLLRSDLYRKLDQRAQAIDDLSAILRAEPADILALLTRATLYREQLQGRLAKEDFEHACMLGSAEACKQIP